MAQLDTTTDRTKIIRARVELRGIIQGVGFRPFIYRLAKTLGLTGHVANTAAGVTIEIDGATETVEHFVNSLVTEKPPLAFIETIEVATSPINPDKSHPHFEIIESISSGNIIGPITPDSDVCSNCLVELFDPDDRRYLYPFINCTDCGPRYTLIEKTPYDRPLTAMKHFDLCFRCQGEYNDPLDRRFHAQATCCPACGPEVSLCSPDGHSVASSSPIRTAADMLKEGKIVAIKGIGGFHLAVDGCNSGAVRKLRERKERPEKPLAVMSANPARIKTFARLSPAEEKLLCDRAKPILLLEKKLPFHLAENVAPDNRFIGVMLPYTPIHHLLFYYHNFYALVMTSGNLSGSPVIKDNDDALAKLASIADCFLLHNRPIVTQADDSVMRVSGDFSAIYRRARSFVPSVVTLRNNAGSTLALGAIIKNTICLTKGNEAYVSQHIGDLDNLDTQQHQRNISSHFQGLLRIEPDLLVHDLHPDYAGTRFARSQKELPTIGVQHHHAHAVSCMAEHGLAGPVIAVTLDGNGYGPDHTVWGGEVLLAHYDAFQRAAHLETVAMPGGDAAIRQPWRMAISHLYHAFGNDFTKLDLRILRDHADRITIIQQMIDRSFNSPLTSSCGRLFDSVAALLSLRFIASFEGQAAAELEMLLEPGFQETTTYPFEIVKSDTQPWQLPTKPIIRAIVNDILENTGPQVISRRFHNTLAALFSSVCREVREHNNISQVVLSGGVFQNLNLLHLLKTNLEALSFKVYAHAKVPSNDGGISLGQAIAGRAMWEKRN